LHIKSQHILTELEKFFLLAAEEENSHAFDLCAGKSRHCKYFLMPARKTRNLGSRGS